MGRNGQLIRQWNLLRKLAANRYGSTILDLAGAFEVSTRTIRRDLECLEDAGFPIYVVESEEGHRWKMRRDHATEILIRLNRVEGDPEEE